MRWRRRVPQDEYEWHYWFAWHPVAICEYRVWWEVIERRRSYSSRVNYWDYRIMVPE